MGPKDAYHHGNLRRALLDESLAVIGEKGVEGLSLREVAARVGVSNAAPYHHFSDKTALLRVLAREAMDQMDLRMSAAQADALADPSQQLLAIGMAYVGFAIERPDYYAVMTASELSSPEARVAAGARDAQSAAGTPGDASGATWVRLVTAVVACQQTGGMPPGDPVIYAVYLWSLVHGLAELWRTGPLRMMPQAAEGFGPLARRVLWAAFGGMEAAAELGAGECWHARGGDPDARDTCRHALTEEDPR